MKTNVLLALLDQKASVYKALVNDYAKFFKNDQGQFKGVKKTYDPNPDTVDEPSMRGLARVVTTVDEKLEYFTKHAVDYIDKKLSVEATNSSGQARADLIVEGKKLGNLTSQELLSLKSLLENKELMTLWSTIPVRSDSEIWTKSENELYSGREVYEKPQLSGIKKSITKEQYILEDPNISKFKDSSAYKPQIATKDTPMELGKWTAQEFSGEWTHLKRASLLGRREILYTAVIEALKKANEVEAVPSELKGEQILNFIHNGII